MSLLALEQISARCYGYITDCKDTTLVCVFCYFGIEKLKKESNVGHFDNKSNITENRMLASTRTPDVTAIQYL